MATLVLCIDRDNDLGDKAHIKSPIIGRDDNMNAAIALGLTDPEDSDTNALFEAIRTYDDLIARGEKAEIATICGSTYVGLESDRILSEQIDYLIDKLKPTGVIVVSDGTEDEFIMPIINSRIKVESLKRVIMKQSQGVEELYYIIRKNLGNARMRRSFVIPVALIFITYAVAAFLNYSDFGIAAIIGVLGVYLLIRAIDLREKVSDTYNELAINRISVITSLIAALLVIARSVQVYYAQLQPVIESGAHIEFIPFVLDIVDAMIFVVIAACLIIVAGKAIDRYLRKGDNPWRYWLSFFSLPAIGLIIYYASWFIRESIKTITPAPSIPNLLANPQIIYLIAAIALISIGVISNRYLITKKYASGSQLKSSQAQDHEEAQSTKSSQGRTFKNGVK